jgi:hypothetical protein
VLTPGHCFQFLLVMPIIRSSSFALFVHVAWERRGVLPTSFITLVTATKDTQLEEDQRQWEQMGLVLE